MRFVQQRKAIFYDVIMGNHHPSGFLSRAGSILEEEQIGASILEGAQKLSEVIA